MSNDFRLGVEQLVFAQTLRYNPKIRTPTWYPSWGLILVNKCALVGNPESADNAGSLADAFNRKEQETGILPCGAGIDIFPQSLI